MSRRKQYKNRLPTVLPPLTPPAPRPVPATEQVPQPEPQPEPAPDTHPGPRAVPEPRPEPEPRREAPAPVSRATLLWEDESPPRSRRRAAALVGVALVALLAVAALGGVLAFRPGDDGAAPTTGVPPTDASVPSGAAPVQPGTSRVETTVGPGGSVVVRQRVRSREPMGTLTLALPDLPGGGAVRASAVRVVADGRRVAGPREVTASPVELDLGGATDLRVSYRLAGVVQVSDSAPGRALVLATSLDARWDPASDEETRVVRAPQVLALACASASGQEPVPCGTSEGPGQWRVDLPGERRGERVVAQLTVPGLGGRA